MHKETQQEPDLFDSISQKKLINFLKWLTFSAWDDSWLNKAVKLILLWRHKWWRITHIFLHLYVNLVMADKRLYSSLDNHVSQPCFPWDRWPSSSNRAAAFPCRRARPSLGWGLQPGCSPPTPPRTSPRTGTGSTGWSEGLGNKWLICPLFPTCEGAWRVRRRQQQSGANGSDRFAFQNRWWMLTDCA